MVEKHKVSLGFAPGCFDQGIHVCQIINDNEERVGALVEFLVSGLKDNERSTCFSSMLDTEEFAERLSKEGLSYDKCCNDGDFNCSPPDDIYFQNDQFNPDTMLDLLKNYYLDSVDQNYVGARVIGEMLPKVEKVKGGDRLFEYECRVSKLVEKYPVTAVCQYDANQFSGAVIMDVLKVHPFMIVRGELVKNPFFIPPDEYLSKIGYVEHECGCNCDHN